MSAHSVPDQIGDGRTTVSSDAFKRSELARLHENLDAFGLGHGQIMRMHMCMSIRDQNLRQSERVNMRNRL